MRFLQRGKTPNPLKKQYCFSYWNENNWTKIFSQLKNNERKGGAGDVLYGGVSLWAHHNSSDAKFGEGHDPECLTTQSNNRSWKLCSVVIFCNLLKLWRACGVGLGKQKVISFSSKWSSGISEGCRMISWVAASNGLFRWFTFMPLFATDQGSLIFFFFFCNYSKSVT